MDMLRLHTAANSSPSNDVMDKAKRVWDMLDELASSDPSAYKNYIEKTLKEGKQWMTPPTPCFAVRSTLQKHSRIKTLYLNVFTWTRLPAPENTDEPIRLYPLKPVETMHTKETCMVINIAVHPNVMDNVPRAQLIQSILSLVASQNNLSVDYDRYRILDEKVIGNVEEQQQAFLKPVPKQSQNSEDIEELLDTNLSPSLVKQLTSMTTPEQSSSHKQEQQSKPSVKPVVLIEELWRIPTFTEELAANNNALIIRVSLPDCEGVADCDLSAPLEEDAILVECSRLHMRLKLDMKERKKPSISHGTSTFATKKLTAKFVRKTHQLVLTIPVIVEPMTNS